MSEVKWCGANWRDIREIILFWSEVSYVEVLRDKSNMHIRVTLYWEYLIVFWLFYLVCLLYCFCFNLFFNTRVCVCVGFVMCGYVYVWVLKCVDVCMCGFWNVWMCGCVGFVMCWVFWQLYGCFGNMCTCIYFVFVLFRLCICILICY